MYIHIYIFNFRNPRTKLCRIENHMLKPQVFPSESITGPVFRNWNSGFGDLQRGCRNRK